MIIFILYAIITWAVYTSAYFYLSNEYECPKEIGHVKFYLIITSASIIIGITWPIIIIISCISIIYKLKNK